MDSGSMNGTAAIVNAPIPPLSVAAITQIRSKRPEIIQQMATVPREQAVSIVIQTANDLQMATLRFCLMAVEYEQIALIANGQTENLCRIEERDLLKESCDQLAFQLARVDESLKKTGTTCFGLANELRQAKDNLSKEADYQFELNFVIWTLEDEKATLSLENMALHNEIVILSDRLSRCNKTNICLRDLLKRWKKVRHNETTEFNKLVAKAEQLRSDSQHWQQVAEQAEISKSCLRSELNDSEGLRTQALFDYEGELVDRDRRIARLRKRISEFRTTNKQMAKQKCRKRSKKNGATDMVIDTRESKIWLIDEHWSEDF